MSSPYCIEERGDKVAECLPDPRGGFHDQVTPSSSAEATAEAIFPCCGRSSNPRGAQVRRLREYRLEVYMNVGVIYTRDK